MPTIGSTNWLESGVSLIGDKAEAKTVNMSVEMLLSQYRKIVRVVNMS